MLAYEELEFINIKGNKISFSEDSPYRLVSIEGLGDVDVEMHAQRAPFMDGMSFVDNTLEQRYMPVEIVIRADNYKKISTLRRSLNAVLNPKMGLGELRYKPSKDETYTLKATVESLPFYPDKEDRGKTHQRALIDFVAPNPYWRSLNQESKPLQAYTGKFMLPMTFPFELGVSGSRTILYNEGDAPAPVQIEINGPITNPQIFNRTTGEFIRINRSINEGDKILIDTTPGQKSVIIDERNGFGYLDPDSTLFKLDIGENEIEHVADSGNRHAEVLVKWQNRYVGV